MGLHHAVWVDVENARLGHINLVPAYGAVGGDNLAVEIGDAHLVVVEEVDGSHTTASEHLGGIASHASHAKNGYSALCKRVDGFLAKKEL